jgi:two-component system sensor histidine kinase BarA
MAHSSLRTRILMMTALPAFLAALVIGGYTLVHRVLEVRADTAHRQQLIIESYAGPSGGAGRRRPGGL